MKRLVFGVCVALLVLGAFVGAVSVVTGYAEEGSIQAAAGNIELEGGES